MVQLRQLSEDEFEGWLTPREALAELAGMGSHHLAATAINERLGRGLINAAAKLIIQEKRGTKSNELSFWPILPAIWKGRGPSFNDAFWKTGQVRFADDTFTHYETVTELYGVRFDPKGIDEIKRDSGVAERPRPDDAPPHEEHPPAEDARPNLPRAEMERFCRSVLVGWPDLTQDWAYEKAVRFFAEYKVPRDTFRSILRSIRGPTKPGKRAKSTE